MKLNKHLPIITKLSIQYNKKYPYIEVDEFISEGYIYLSKMKYRYIPSLGEEGIWVSCTVRFRFMDLVKENPLFLSLDIDEIQKNKITPETQYEFKEILNTLSKEAKYVVELIKKESFYAVNPIREKLISEGWAYYKAIKVFREIREALI